MLRRRKPAIVALSVAITLGTQMIVVSFAGDEVDYSAPYLVVEDGELVTKYPNKEHVVDTATAPETNTGGAEASVTRSSGRLWLVVAITIAVLAAGIFFLQRRNRQRH